MPKRKGRKSGRVTVREVGIHANVSPMTVSRVINGHKYVGEDVRERVLAAIKALNYLPNLAGRSLRTSGAYKIGILYSNPSDAYLNQFLVGALHQSSQSGATLVIEKCGGLKSQRSAVERLIEAGIDGVILPPPLCDSKATLKHLADEGVPLVAFATGRPIEGVNSVRIDDYAAAHAMTRHLIDLGHRDIGFIHGDPKHTPSSVRAEGFLAAMKEAKLAVAPEWIVEGLFTYRSGLVAAESLLKGKRRPTAIFSSNDDMAAAVLSVAHGLGLHIPDDLTVCGFDDTPVATTVWPELTTIHQPVTSMARAAVTLVTEEIRRYRDGKTGSGKHELVKFTLIKRASSAPPKSPPESVQRR